MNEVSVEDVRNLMYKLHNQTCSGPAGICKSRLLTVPAFFNEEGSSVHMSRWKVLSHSPLHPCLCTVIAVTEVYHAVINISCYVWKPLLFV
jgi:hypothetical protein